MFWMLDALIEKMGIAINYIKNNRKAAIIVPTVFLLLVFFIAFLQAVFFKPPPKKSSVLPVAPVAPLFDELLLPAEPALEYKYELFRQPEHLWTDEEINRWFSEPDGAVFEELQRANTAIINDILGAVP